MLVKNKKLPLLRGSFLFVFYLPFRKRHIFFYRRNAFIIRTNDFTVVGQLFYAVRGPSHNSGNGENRRKQFHRYIKHGINKARIKVHVCGNSLINSPLFSYYFRSKTLYFRVKLVVVFSVFCRGQAALQIFSLCWRADQTENKLRVPFRK